MTDNLKENHSIFGNLILKNFFGGSASPQSVPKKPVFQQEESIFSGKAEGRLAKFILQ